MNHRRRVRLRRWLARVLAAAVFGAAVPAGAGAVAPAVSPAPAGRVPVAVCAPFAQLRGLEGFVPTIVEGSYQGQVAATQSLHSAVDAMRRDLSGVAPSWVPPILTALRGTAIMASAPAGPSVPVGQDVWKLRVYLADTCGGLPGTWAQERAITTVLNAWAAKLPAGCGADISEIQVAQGTPSYAAATVTPVCQAPGGGTAWLRQANSTWKLRGVLQAIPCGQAPDPVLAVLFGADVPALCASQIGATGGTPRIASAAAASGTEIAGSYPMLSGLRSSPIQGAINAAIRRAVGDTEAWFRRLAGAHRGASLRLGFTVVNLSPELASIQIRGAARWAGGGTVSVHTLNFAVESGYQWQLKDLFLPGADYSALLSAAARRQLSARLGARCFTDWSAWALAKTGLQVTCGGLPAPFGTPTFSVPYADPVLNSLARPGSPLVSLTSAG